MSGRREDAPSAASCVSGPVRLGVSRGALVLILTLASLLPIGCTPKDSTPTGQAETTDAAASSTPSLEGYDAIPVEGDSERAALQDLAAVLADQEASGSWPDTNWDTYRGVDPRLVAYIVKVELDGQTALFEVRADGIAHNLHGYQRAFDSGSIIWTPAEGAPSGSQASSAGETLATSAVEAAMRDAFPDDPFTVSIRGYRFAYVVDNATPFVIEIAPDGALISVSM